MGILTCPNVLELGVGETEIPAVSYEDVLETTETITGTPTVADEGSSGDLTIASVAASTGELTIENVAVAVGRALQFTVSGQTVANSPYALVMIISTTGGRLNLKRRVILEVVTE